MDYTGPYAKELHLACLTVQRATLLTKKLLEAVDKGILDKSDDTPVTIADFASQSLIIGAIHHVFPDDEFVGEEDSRALRLDEGLLERTWELASGTSLDNEEGDGEGRLYKPGTREEMLGLIDLGARGQCTPRSRAWVLDPVDGTATFMRGQQYAVCLSLVENGQQKVGVLGGPNLGLENGRIQEDVVDREGYGHQLFAVVGQGTWIRKMGTGALLPASKVEPVPQITDPGDIRFIDCSSATSSNYELHAQVAVRLGAPWPPLGDLWAAQLRYVAIAVGGCNVLIKVPRKHTYRSKIWDHSGGMLLAQELGVVVSDLAGNPVDCSLGRTLAGCYGMVAAPASIHGRVVEAIRETMGENLS